MEPFEISLTFIRVLGKKKNSTGILFVCADDKGPWGIQNQAALSNAWMSVYWFILDSFWYCVFCAGLWGFSQAIYVQKRQGCLFIFLSSLAFFPHCHKRFQTGLCLFWHGRALLSLTSPLGTNLCSLKTSECNKTWSNMQQRCHAPEAHSTQNLHSDGFLLICAVCTWSIVTLNETFRQLLIKTLVQMII